MQRQKSKKSVRALAIYSIIASILGFLTPFLAILIFTYLDREFSPKYEVVFSSMVVGAIIGLAIGIAISLRSKNRIHDEN